jgi:hypothetical protein
LQFGARPAINETLSDDNTQALFEPAQQTCTEAFFVQIHENNPNVNKDPMQQQNKEMTVSFFTSIEKILLIFSRITIIKLLFIE